MTDSYRRLFIDDQAALDLAVGVLAEGHTWEALRDALLRAIAFWPEHLPSAVGEGLRLE